MSVAFVKQQQQDNDTELKEIALTEMTNGEEQVPLLSDGQAQDASTEPTKKRSTLLTVCPYILGNELCERLAYYGLATNLVTYITKIMGGDPAFAAIVVAVFEGVTYTTPILGALLADSVWGRYKTILVFSSIYLVGVIMLALSSIVPDSDDDQETANPLQFGLLFASLAVISLGTGGIKPNVSAFGADQFNEADPQDRKEKESFFNWFYMAINVGSLFACSVIVYIQDQVSWTLGFSIPGVAMALAICLFWAGSRHYRMVLPTESPMTRVVRVVIAATKNRWARKSTPDPSVTAQRVIASSQTPPPGEGGSSLHGSYHGGQLYSQSIHKSLLHDSHMNGDGGVNGNGTGFMTSASLTRADSLHQMPMAASMSYRWLEDAVTEWQTSQGQLVHTGSLAGYTPKQVEEVKLVLRLLPVFATSVMYWTVWCQMSTLFVQQGNLMNREVKWGDASFTVPSASMSVFNTVAVIVLIYVYDAWFEPALKGTRFKMTLLRRQGWGMVVACIAMVYAGGLEYARLKSFGGLEPCPPNVSCRTGPPDSTLGNRSLFETHTGPFGGIGAPLRALLYAAGAGGDASGGVAGVGGPMEAYYGQCLCANEPSSLSIFWQGPVYILIGLSEVFTSIGQLEFFYDQAPDVMRSCSMALCLLSTALGSYLAGALTLTVQAVSKRATGTEWLPRDLNKGHMDYFFFVLLALMTVNVGLFLWVAMRYQYKSVEHKKRIVLEEDEAAHRTLVVGPPAQPGTSNAARQQSITGRVVPTVHQAGPTRAHTAPVAIGARQGTSLTAAAGAQDSGTPDLEVYARSLAWVPPSPNIPAPFR